MLPPPVLNALHTVLAPPGDAAPFIRNFTPSAGGCIHNGGRLTTTQGTFFVKWNDARKFPGMFEAEARGLNLLRTAHALAVPAVIGTHADNHVQILVLAFVESAAPGGDYWHAFGRQLAGLHRCTAPLFGLDHTNYIGSLPQHNAPSPSGTGFFIHARLQPQLALALERGRLQATHAQKFEQLYQQLPSLLPAEQPALVHGDLWSGNLMVGSTGAPCVIDPAVYYGNREADLAMTQLFGGFDNRFLNSYHEAFPLQPGYADRLDIYNLYPLLVHVNLFGGGYASQVNSILNRFVS